MDHLALIAVLGEMSRDLPGARVADFRQETEHRFRLVVVAGESARTYTVSLRPEAPWIGWAPRGRSDGRPRTTSFAAEVKRAVHDRIVAGVVRQSGTRGARIDLVEGPSLVAELTPNAANLVLVDRAGEVRIAARHPRSARDRLAVGAAYRAPLAPADLADPLETPPDRIDSRVRALLGGGLDRVLALRRAVLGLSAESARRLLDDAVRRRCGIGEAVRWRSERLARGVDAPVVEYATDAPGDRVLLPFVLDDPAPPGRSRSAGRTIAATVGEFHDRIERDAWIVERRAGLVALLRREIRRLERIESRVRSDLASFEDPDETRRSAEAILAGLRVAERRGDLVLVPDPYAPDGSRRTVRIDPAVPLTRAADVLFARHRRAVRGLRAAEERRASVETRLRRLVAIERDVVEDGDGGAEAVEELEGRLRSAGIAVGLDAPRRARLASVAAGARPRPEGVRMFTSDADVLILAGKSARDNQHLTFRIAQPEDFWFHALGCTGAHVVARNPERRRRPDPDTLRQAAAAAAWFSEARTQTQVDVQWTRRKYVRKARGGGPGAVVLKRFETVRVAPSAPGEDGEGDR